MFPGVTACRSTGQMVMPMHIDGALSSPCLKAGAPRAHSVDFIVSEQFSMQHFSRYGRALSRMSGKGSAHAINQQIDAMVVRRLRDIQPGDLVRYASDWPVLRVISVSPQRIETVNGAGQIITFNGVESVVPGIRLHDPVTVNERLCKVSN